MKRSLCILFVVTLLAAISIAPASAQMDSSAGAPTNAAAQRPAPDQTPVLGWSSWSFIRKQPTAAKIKAQALALKESGLTELGYQYVNLDDFWYLCPGSQGPDVDKYGRWVTDPSIFPPQGNTDGIQVVAEYVHSLGEKFGIYVTPGISQQAVAKNTPIKGTAYTADQIADRSVPSINYNCKGMVGINYSKPGAQEYTNSWVDMLASWGVDYIKLDGITNKNTADIKAWSEAIRQSGRPMVLDVTRGKFTIAIASVLTKYANQWEISKDDIECYNCEKNGSSYPLTDWTHVANRFDYVARWQPYASPGAFNDYDSIEVGNDGNDGLTPAERQTQMSLWALGGAPLILGTDLTHLDPADLALLKSTAVLAVDQDSIAATRVVKTHTQQVFAKKEKNGDVIVGLFNTGSKTQTVSVKASLLGLPKSRGGYLLKNLWTGESTKAGATIGASVPSHGVVLYRVRAVR